MDDQSEQARLEWLAHTDRLADDELRELPLVQGELQEEHFREISR